MEMTLHFVDTESFEMEKFKRAITADRAYGALWDIDQYLRNKLKHEDLDMKEYEIIDKIRTEIDIICGRSRYEFVFMIVEKILLFSISLIMMTALKWMMPLGAAIVIIIFMVLEFIKHVRPKTRRKPRKPKPIPMLQHDGSYRRR